MRKGRQAPGALRALRAAVSVRVRGAVPSCPCAAHAGLGPLPAFLGEPWLPMGVAGLPVRAPEPCGVGV